MSLNAIAIAVKMVPREVMKCLFCVCLKLYWGSQRGVFNAKLVPKVFDSHLPLDPSCYGSYFVTNYSAPKFQALNKVEVDIPRLTVPDFPLVG